MLTLPASVRIYVAAEAVDLRRGFDGLAAARYILHAAFWAFCLLPRRSDHERSR
jgi:hypothetical protein